MLRSTIVLFAVATAISAGGFPERPSRLTAEQVRTAVRNAPAVPVDAAPGQTLRLVDYIDCTNPADPHDFIDQGTSVVTQGEIGTYRSTAAHRHAFFSYRFKAYAQDRPHLIVFEYPDDAERMICFFMHESRITGGRNHMWSLESGVYTGRTFPVTNRMQYHTFYFWPVDSLPAVIVANWNRHGAPAAASRIWIFAVEGGLKPARISVPDRKAGERVIGTLHNWSLVPVRGAFGLTSHGTVFDHIAEYYAGLGANLVSWPVLSTSGWANKCIVPAFGITENAYDPNANTVKGSDELDSILTACDKRGIHFLPTFEMGFKGALGGITVKKGDKDDPNNARLRDVYKKGFKEFIERYGEHESLYGLSFDTPDLSPKYGEAVLDVVDQVFEGGIPEFVAYLKSLKPELRILTYLGYRSIHAQYFPKPWYLYEKWEQGATDWQRLLVDEVDSLWCSPAWNRDPSRLAAIGNLELCNQYQFDDAAIFEYYSQNPRAHLYEDLERAQEKSNLQDTRAVMLFNTFFEGYFGLDTNNYWYKKLWVAPDFNPSPPYALAAYALALEHRDRDMILAGSWNVKPAGQEMLLRPWIKAFRSLPPVEMGDVPVPAGAPLKVRQALYEKKNYVYALNTGPFPQKLVISFKKGKTIPVELPPFGLQTLVMGKKETVKGVEAVVSDNFINWVKGRTEEFDALITELRTMDSDAAGPAYTALSEQVNLLLGEGNYTAADRALGVALPRELRMRRDLIARKAEKVNNLSAAPVFDGDLAAWPPEANLIPLDTPEDMPGHLYMPHAWSGKDDFSAVLRYGHTDSMLYLGLQVTDDVLTGKDDAVFSLSRTGYRDWRGDLVPCDFVWKQACPDTPGTVTGTDSTGARYAVTRAAGGYTYEMAVPKRLVGGGSVPFGFYVQLADYDNDPNTASAGWARKSVMLHPNRPYFPYWEDARTCKELILSE